VEIALVIKVTTTGVFETLSEPIYPFTEYVKEGLGVSISLVALFTTTVKGA
jgi:hypothetical protein